MWTVALTDEPQNRLIVAAATLSGKAGCQSGPSRDVAHSFVGYVDAAGDDVFDLLEGYPDALAGTSHRHAQQIIEPQMRQRSPVARERCPYPAQNKRLSHRRHLSEGT